jgi:hypothetical protein
MLIACAVATAVLMAMTWNVGAHAGLDIQPAGVGVVPEAAPVLAK